MVTGEEATSAMVDLSTTGGSAQFVLEKGLWRHGQQGSDVSSHSSTCSCGLHFGWQTLCSGQRFSAAGDPSVSRPTQSGSQSSNRCWLLPPGEWRQSWAAAWTATDSPGAPVWAW